MELLLNLCWILLTAPAFYLFARRQPRSNPLQCLATLGCLLVLLFPVISASDDLCAMRQEMEESNSSSSVLRQPCVDKASGQDQFGSSPAQLTSRFSIQLCNDISASIFLRDAAAPRPAERTVRPGRAPPSFSPG